jgi:glycosyltransferase involved in cell wall biosynthesis
MQPLAPLAHGRTPRRESYGIIVHSHLRWDFVWQRPQQILSRLARTNPVLFVEEPILLDDIEQPSLDLASPCDNVTRAIPRLPRKLGESYDDAIALIGRLVERARRSPLLGGRFDEVVQWFYTPMPAPEMLDAFGERAVVYDCMDELSRFRFAPSDLARRERLLLSRADVVFTGGHRLFESKSRYHDNVHFFGCGVDALHFGRARDPATPLPDDVAALPRPILGYVGVIDERIDYTLLHELAGAQEDWTIVMLGPLAKVNGAELPRSANIHWIGQRRYDELPGYVKAFDVCLMPFALNESTEYINPTKTLEYMACGKPIVATAVPDVVRNFTPVVRVARDYAEFIEAARRALTAPDASLIEEGIARATAEGWEPIVRRMHQLTAAALTARATERDVDEVLDASSHPGAAPEPATDAP